MVGAMIDGRVRIETKSIAQLFDTVQPNTSTPNRSRRGSSLVTYGSTTLFGDAWVGEFANITMLEDSSLSGHLSCFHGGEAYCDVPAAQTGSSDCGQCANPPPP